MTMTIRFVESGALRPVHPFAGMMHHVNQAVPIPVASTASASVTTGWELTPQGNPLEIRATISGRPKDEQGAVA
jgi:hypothetical protein